MCLELDRDVHELLRHEPQPLALQHELLLRGRRQLVPRLGLGLGLGLGLESSACGIWGDGEIQRKYGGDMGEMQGRYGRDAGEIWARCLERAPLVEGGDEGEVAHRVVPRHLVRDRVRVRGRVR